MRLRKVGRLLGLLSIAALCGLSLWLWDPLPKNPSARLLSASSHLYDVEVIRDNWGIPHIYGKRNSDVAFGVAYVNAEDDIETLMASVAATRGVLARYQGKDAAVTDYLVKLFGIWDRLEARYESEVPEDIKAYARAYAAGLNHYASEQPAKIWPGLAPFREQDVLAGFMLKTPFFYGFDKTLLDLIGDERQAQIALDPSGEKKAWHVGPKDTPERGSNAIAVAPQRSGDGTTRLLLNSHQPMEGPVTWWEAHLISEEGLDITGGLFAGTPIILHGFNQHLGWANTVSEQDLADIYKLHRNPKNKTQYKLDDKWLEFETQDAQFRIRLFGPFAIPVKRKILHSKHGPVIEAKHGSYAIRYAGMNEIRQLEQYYRLNHSTDYESFMAAMSMNALPSINYIYADKYGDIALIHNGQYPARDNTWNWNADMPGDRSDLIWSAYRPFSDVPVLTNPVSGVIYNSNNTPFTSTDGPDNLRAQDFPQSMGLQTNQTSRSLRMMELLPQYSRLDREALLAIKFDTAYAKGSKADKVRKAVLAKDWSQTPKLAKAAAHLAKWDLHMQADSPYAALGGLTVIHKVTEKYTGIPAPKPEDAFERAVTYLMTHHGRIDVAWGEVNRLIRGDVNLPLSGGSDTLRAIYPSEMGDDGYLKAAAGDTWIALVEWDESGAITADLVHQFGAATSDSSSPHYADQAPLFAAHKWRKALLTRDEIEASARCIYRPGKQTPPHC